MIRVGRRPRVGILVDLQMRLDVYHTQYNARRANRFPHR